MENLTSEHLAEVCDNCPALTFGVITPFLGFKFNLQEQNETMFCAKPLMDATLLKENEVYWAEKFPAGHNKVLCEGRFGIVDASGMKS